MVTIFSDESGKAKVTGQFLIDGRFPTGLLPETYLTVIEVFF